MTTTLKQFQGSVVDPKDDAKVYQFLGGVSGVVADCVVTLYATNQLKVSEGWGFACGRVFVIEEEIVVANTAAAKGRIIVNIDLENIAKPACLATQSAAVLPALVQEDINADGTVFQLALAQYDIASNTISNLTDVRVMLYDVDSRINAKQDKISNVANQLFYGSGTSGTLNQLANPATAGSVLRQDTSGAPYWDNALLEMQSFAEVLIGSTQTIATTARTKLNFNSRNYNHDPYGLFTVNSTGIKVNQSGFYSLYYYVDLGAVTGAGSGGVLWIGTNNDQQRYHRRLDGGNNADYADTKLMYMAAGEYVYISIQQGAATSNKYGAARSQAQIVLRPIKLE